MMQTLSAMYSPITQSRVYPDLLTIGRVTNLWSIYLVQTLKMPFMQNRWMLNQVSVLCDLLTKHAFDYHLTWTQLTNIKKLPILCCPNLPATDDVCCWSNMDLTLELVDTYIGTSGPADQLKWLKLGFSGLQIVYPIERNCWIVVFLMWLTSDFFSYQVAISYWCIVAVRKGCLKIKQHMIL